VRQGDVGTDVETQPQVGEGRRLRLAWIDHHELGALPDSLQNMVEKDGMRRASIRSP